MSKDKCRINTKSCLILIMKYLFDFNEKKEEYTYYKWQIHRKNYSKRLNDHHQDEIFFPMSTDKLSKNCSTSMSLLLYRAIRISIRLWILFVERETARGCAHVMIYTYKCWNRLSSLIMHLMNDHIFLCARSVLRLSRLWKPKYRPFNLLF